MVSSELPELIGLCDRVLVVREGLITGEVAGDAMTEENIIRLASFTERARARAAGVRSSDAMRPARRRAERRPTARGGLGRAARPAARGRAACSIILLLFAVMSFASPYFLTWENMRAMTMAFAIEGIVVVGMTILLISGGIDLSVGSVVAFAMVLAGWLFLQGVDPWVASGLAILASAGIGLAMGLCVTRIGLHHFIVSLAFMVIVRGACLLFTGGRPLGLFTLPPEFKFIGQGSVGADPVRDRHLRDLRAGLRLPAAPLDRLPQGLLHRQQREGGAPIRASAPSG